VDGPPLIAVIAGPNGAGKSTAAAALLPEGLPFLNADEIARALPGYPSQAADILAGRQLLASMNLLERERTSFAVETTLASRTLAPRIARLRRSGYFFELVFLWTPSADFSIERVAGRVRLGGHSIPEKTIRRRYKAGLENLFQSFLPMADAWRVYDNSQFPEARLISEGTVGRVERVLDQETWMMICNGARS
jgi:predicted ABC-type ATPase